MTVTGVTASNKVYDGTIGVALDTTAAELSGVVAGDDVTLETGGASGVFDTKDAGTGKTVTVSGLVLSGADAANYVLEQPTTTADIAAANLTVTGVTASNKVYDGTIGVALDTTAAELSGVVAGDDVTLETGGVRGVFDTKDAGTGKTVTVSGLVLSGADAANYVLEQPTTTADIAAATLTVTGVTASNKVYDGTIGATLDTSAAALSGVVAGDDVTLETGGVSGVFDTKNAGTGKTVTIAGLTLSGADASNYVLVQPTTTAEIAAATLTVTGITAADKAFDGTTDAALDTAGAILVGVVSGDDVTLDVSNAVGTFETPDVGTDKSVFIIGLTITGNDSGNYTLTQPTTTASIT